MSIRILNDCICEEKAWQRVFGAYENVRFDYINDKGISAGSGPLLLTVYRLTGY